LPRDADWVHGPAYRNFPRLKWSHLTLGPITTSWVTESAARLRPHRLVGTLPPDVDPPEPSRPMRSLLLLLLPFTLAAADSGKLTVTTPGRPDALGRVRSEVRDQQGRKVGVVETRAQPDALGRVKSVIVDATGKRVGTAETTATPDALGRVKTTFRDATGRTTGTGVATAKPDALGRTTTVFRDTQGQRTGSAVSRPPDALGRVKTEVTGKVPLARPGAR